MNPEWSDKVFDSLTEEVVTGQHPPDLTARISDAWQRERAGQLPLPKATDGNNVLVAPPIAVAPHRPVSEAPTDKSLRRSRFPVALLFAAAASVLLVVGGFQLRNWLLTESAQGDSSLASDHRETTPAANPQTLPKPNKQLATNGESLPLESVPFATTADSLVEQSRESRPSLAAETPRLSDQEIVGLIDSQLSGLWKELNLVPAPRVSDDQLAQALSIVLTGQELPAKEAAELQLVPAANRREKVISSAIDSNAFTRRWADNLVAQWLRGGSLAMNSEPAEKLKQFVAGGIAAGRPWNVRLQFELAAHEFIAGLCPLPCFDRHWRRGSIARRLLVFGCTAARNRSSSEPRSTAACGR